MFFILWRKEGWAFLITPIHAESSPAPRREAIFVFHIEKMPLVQKFLRGAQQGKENISTRTKER